MTEISWIKVQGSVLKKCHKSSLSNLLKAPRSFLFTTPFCWRLAMHEVFCFVCLGLGQAAKANRFVKKNHGNTSITLHQQIFVISGSFFPIEVSYERAENELSRNVIFFLKFRYRSLNKFLVALLHIVFIHSCVKHVSYYEWHQMKEDPSFPKYV